MNIEVSIAKYENYNCLSELLVSLNDYWNLYDREILIKLNFSGAKYISIDKYIILTTFINHLKIDNKVKISVIKGFDNVLRYADRIDFFSSINAKIDLSYKTHESQDVLLEISRLSEANYDDYVTKITHILIEKSRIQPDLIEMIDYTISELMCNIFEHSKSPLGGFVSCQFHPDKKIIRLCFSDNGIGIVDSLRENVVYKDKSDIELFELAFSDSITSGSGKGYGLFATRKFMQSDSKNSFKLQSNRFSALINESNKLKVFERQYIFPGTLIVLDINSECTTNIFNIIDKKKGSWFEDLDIFD